MWPDFLQCIISRRRRSAKGRVSFARNSAQRRDTRRALAAESAEMIQHERLVAMSHGGAVISEHYGDAAAWGMDDWGRLIHMHAI
jgi:hypothetical protein